MQCEIMNRLEGAGSEDATSLQDSGEPLGSRRQRSDTGVSCNPLPDRRRGDDQEKNPWEARSGGALGFQLVEKPGRLQMYEHLAQRSASCWTTLLCQLKTAATKLHDDQSEPLFMLSRQFRTDVFEIGRARDSRGSFWNGYD